MEDTAARAHSAVRATPAQMQSNFHLRRRFLEQLSRCSPPFFVPSSSGSSPSSSSSSSLEPCSCKLAGSGLSSSSSSPSAHRRRGGGREGGGGGGGKETGDVSCMVRRLLLFPDCASARQYAGSALEQATAAAAGAEARAHALPASLLRSGVRIHSPAVSSHSPASLALTSSSSFIASPGLET